MKTICIVSCFDNYQARTQFIEKYYMVRQFEVIHLIADFSHSYKKYIEPPRENVELVHVQGYEKNLSLQRINSHRLFSKRIYKRLIELKPDIVYCQIPPNSVTKQMVKYKKKYPTTTLVFDLFDLWPESLTPKKGKLMLKIPFCIWRNIRDCYINYADCIFTECKMYQNILHGILDANKTATLYVGKKETGLDLQPVADMEEIRLCYIGSINHIIDIEVICNIIKEIVKYKKVTLHIIGDGEAKNIFIKKAQDAGAEICEYGIIYEEVKKYKIMSQCHFGLNIMKDSVCVGLTLKSLCYFEAGLPILNNIKEDTYELVNKYSAGINVSNRDVVEHICSLTLPEYRQMRVNAKMLYLENLSESCLYKQLEKRNL